MTKNPGTGGTVEESFDGCPIEEKDVHHSLLDLIARHKVFLNSKFSCYEIYIGK